MNISFLSRKSLQFYTLIGILICTCKSHNFFSRDQKDTELLFAYTLRLVYTLLVSRGEKWNTTAHEIKSVPRVYNIPSRTLYILYRANIDFQPRYHSVWTHIHTRVDAWVKDKRYTHIIYRREVSSQKIVVRRGVSYCRKNTIFNFRSTLLLLRRMTCMVFFYRFCNARGRLDA